MFLNKLNLPVIIHFKRILAQWGFKGAGYVFLAYYLQGFQVGVHLLLLFSLFMTLAVIMSQ
jgi:hypothetical protein